MEVTNFQTEAPQAGADAQLVNGKSVVGQSVMSVEANASEVNAEPQVDQHDNVETLLHNSGLPKVNGIDPRSIVPRYSVRALIAAGYKPCFDENNRDISKSQVLSLFNDLNASGLKIFSEAGKIVGAEILLRESKRLWTSDGVEITLDTPDLDKYFVILDGQHRIMVCLLHSEIDMLVEPVDLKGCSSNSYYVRLNTTRRNHSGKDQKEMIRKSANGKATLLEESRKLVDNYKISEKAAEGWLTGKVDQYRKKDLAEFQLGKKQITTEFDVNPMKLEVAQKCLAILCEKHKSEKELKKFQIGVAVWDIYDGLTNTEQQEFPTLMPIFLSNMAKTDMESIVEAIPTKELNKVFRKAYAEFCKSLTLESRKTMETDLSALTRTINTAKTTTTAPVKGSFHTVYSELKAKAAKKTDKN